MDTVVEDHHQGIEGIEYKDHLINKLIDENKSLLKAIEEYEKSEALGKAKIRRSMLLDL